MTMNRETNKSRSTSNEWRLVKFGLLVVLAVILLDIVVPRFGRGSGISEDEMNESSLRSNLQVIRSQIDLYRIQHNDLLPGENCLGEAITEGAFVAALTGRTDENGYCDSAGEFGPYLMRIPVNVYVSGDKGDRVTVLRDGGEFVAGSGQTGWAFDESTGVFYAWDSAAHTGL